MRDQGITHSCPFVAGVACIEMNCKKLKKEEAGTIEYFLNVQRFVWKFVQSVLRWEKIEGQTWQMWRFNGWCVSICHRPRSCGYYPVQEPRLEELVLSLLRMCKNIWIIIHKICAFMQNWYLLSLFQPPRQKILSFACLVVDKSFAFSSHTPIVAAMYKVYDSFNECKQTCNHKSLEDFNVFFSY